MADPRRVGPAPLSDEDARTARALCGFHAPVPAQPQSRLQFYGVRGLHEQQRQAQAQAQRHVQLQPQPQLSQQQVPGDGRSAAAQKHREWREAMAAVFRQSEQQQAAAGAPSGGVFAAGGGAGLRNSAFGHVGAVGAAQTAPPAVASNAMAYAFPAARAPTTASNNWMQQQIQQQIQQQLQQQLRQQIQQQQQQMQEHEHQQIRDDPQKREQQMHAFHELQSELHRKQQEKLQLQQEKERQEKRQRQQEQRKQRRKLEQEKRRLQEEEKARRHQDGKQRQEQEQEQERWEQQQAELHRREQEQLHRQWGADHRTQQQQLQDLHCPDRQHVTASQPAFFSQPPTQVQYPPSANSFQQSAWGNGLQTPVVLPGAVPSFDGVNFSTGRRDSSPQHRVAVPANDHFLRAFPNAQRGPLRPLLPAAPVASLVGSTFGAEKGAGASSSAVNFSFAPAPVHEQHAHGGPSTRHQDLWARELEKALATVRSSPPPAQAQRVQTGSQHFATANDVRGHQEAAAPLAMASASTPNEAFLSSVAVHSSSDAAPSAVRSAIASANGATAVVPRGAPLNGAPALRQVETQGCNSTPLPIPPARAVVVPGMALSMPARTSVMRIQSLLNADETVTMHPAAASKRPQKRKQDKLGAKANTPRKKAAVKRMRKQKPLKGGHDISLPNPTAGSASTHAGQPAQVFDPARLGLLGTQVSRGLQQASDMSRTRPVTPSIPQIPPPSKPRTTASSTGKTAKQAVADKSKASTQPRKRAPAKRKKKSGAVTSAALLAGSQAAANGGNSSVQPGTDAPVATGGASSMMLEATGKALQPGTAPRTEREKLVRRTAEFALKSAGLIPSTGDTFHPRLNATPSSHSDRPQQSLPTSGPSQSAKRSSTAAGTSANLQHGAPPQPVALQPLKQAVPGAAAPRGSKSTAKRKAKANLPRPRPSTVTSVNAQPAPRKPPGGLPVGVTATTATGAASVSAATAHVDNRTVVIFCKRDFMRYQAAKIWRKYQEQLKRHEDWRVVRMPGKRTRYLSSRYEDEIRKAHDKSIRSHKKVSQPRKRVGARRPTQEISQNDQVMTPVAMAPAVATPDRLPMQEGQGKDQIMTSVPRAPVVATPGLLSTQEDPGKNQAVTPVEAAHDALVGTGVTDYTCSSETVAQPPPAPRPATSTVQLVVNTKDDRPSLNGKGSHTAKADTTGSVSADVPTAASDVASASASCEEGEGHPRVEGDSLQCKTETTASPLVQEVASTSVEPAAAPVTKRTCTPIVVHSERGGVWPADK